MSLNRWAADRKRTLFDELSQGLEPSLGEFDRNVLTEAKAKGRPQMGATVYSPQAARFEFIYSDTASSATVLTVTVAAPERIVYLPVPDWVVENVWQGSVDGSHVFDSEAETAVAKFLESLKPQANAELFGPRQATRRE
ncbi:MAG: hypothetical protein JST30_02595 [Armatimonadetes bacterium]|nr:hypothetical protein [Armatimonadota bacterium]